MARIERINKEDVMEIKIDVEKLHNLQKLYDMTEQMFPKEYNYYEAVAIRRGIEDLSEKVLDSIKITLGEMYDDYSGRTEKKYLRNTDMNKYYEEIDAIWADDCEKEGECSYLIGLKGVTDISIEYLPMVFMREFIETHGIFATNKEMDVWAI